MRTLLGLLLVFSIGLLGSGASEFAHVRLTHAGAAHDHDHAADIVTAHAVESSGAHAGKHDVPAHGTPERHACTVCLVLSLIGKASQAPPAASWTLPPAVAVLVAVDSFNTVVLSDAFSPTAAPRGPPLV